MQRDYSRYYKRLRLWTQEPSTRISGLVSLTILTVAFFLGFAILPTLKTIAQLNREIRDKEGVDSKLSKKIAALETAKTTYLTVEKELELVERVLPNQEEFERLSWQINWLAEKMGVKIVAGSFAKFSLVGQPADKEEVGKIAMELSISGDYGQIKNFVDELTGFDRLVTIESLAISAKSLKQGQPLKANLELTAYFLPEK